MLVSPLTNRLTHWGRLRDRSRSNQSLSSAARLTGRQRVHVLVLNVSLPRHVRNDLSIWAFCVKRSEAYPVHMPSHRRFVVLSH
jgi:hypothetical protein